MHEVYFSSVSDTLLVAIPFIALVALAVSRVDTLFGASRASSNRRRPACGVDERGEPLLVDPDGRPTPVRRGKK